MEEKYQPQQIEQKWQKSWQEAQLFRAEDFSPKPKLYALDFFPYPSGDGLSVGHCRNYIPTDAFCRYKHMKGFNVLHPMGWDAFGLPAENEAIRKRSHPSKTVPRYIANYKRQMNMIGISYDWSREINSSSPDYYKWTQWFFLLLYKRGLAYRSTAPANWCPSCKTVLANEEVEGGACWRCGSMVEKRDLPQWFFKITDYAERLLNDLELINWPEGIKMMQRNWIGRSEGAYVDFVVAGPGPAAGQTIRVFTTRPDTLFGATYMVLAPEHRLVPVITTSEYREEVRAYCRQAQQKSELDRTAETKTKTGVFTGAYAINPVNRQRVPIWVADYVLISYGTGSIMAVPAHDTRDLEFAEKFGLPVVQVVQPPAGEDWRGFVGDGVAVNSPPDDPAQRFDGQCDLNGLPTPEAKKKITRWLEEHGCGEGTVQYKLRDWLFSRQRYWGEPFPIVHGTDADGRERARALPESALPVVLPDLADFQPVASEDPNAPISLPLSKAPREWREVQIDGRVYRRELNTMPQWAGSCWYYLRFCDPRNDRAFIDRDVERYWMCAYGSGGQPKAGGVDLYVGGAEHAVLHLLYARFWHKVLYDLGYVSTPEPFHRLFNQGMIQAYAYRDRRGVYVEHERVVFRGEEAYHRDTGEKLTVSVEKMSKSLKNVVNPDAIVQEYGADTLRLYEMYMGPVEASKPWNTRDIIGVHRFLQRVWRLVVPPPPEGQTPETPLPPLNPRIGDRGDAGLERLLHKTIRKVTEDVERFAYNTAIAQLIVWVNEAARAPAIGRDQIERFLLILAPFAPHICEELWRRLGHAESLAREPWPTYDEALTRDETVEIAVQINGKVRARIEVATDASDEQIIAAACQNPVIARDLAGRSPRRTIVVRGRLVNLIV